MKTTNSQIIIVPMGGLANRMRAIASGLVLSRKYSRPMTVIWNKNNDLNAPFNLLFETKSLPFNLLDGNNLKYYLYYQYPRKKNLFISRVISSFKGTKLLNIENGLPYGYLDCLLDNYIGDIVITSGLQFYDFDNILIPSIFKFSQRVLDNKKFILENIVPDFALHIRRTDNKEAIKNSPVGLFEKIICDGIADQPMIKYFLATDDECIKHHLYEKFPNNIIFNSRAADRRSEEGMLDAASEMCIMSECDIIYGSYWSSFSEIAASYGNTQLIVVKTG